MTRADKHNALDAEMFRSLDAALDELRAASGLRAVVLSGEGPSFCSGLDFPSFMQDGLDISEELFAHRDGDAANVAQRITYDWQRLPVPVIAALHGNCIGGGAQLALGPDIRVAAPDVRISILEIKYGLIPDMGFSQVLPHLVGLDVAKELIFTGRIVEGAEAQRIGLVTRLADDPRAEALELAAGDRGALTGRDQARKAAAERGGVGSRRGIAGAGGVTATRTAGLPEPNRRRPGGVREAAGRVHGS